MRQPLSLFLGLVAIFGSPCPVTANSVEDAIATIRRVGPEGKGNEEASAAWRILSEQDPEAIVPLLRSMESSGPLARNWIRSALEVIFSRTSRDNPDRLPLEALRAFILDTENLPQARNLAFDLLTTADAEAATALKPGFLNDPSPELRREAVAILIGRGEQLFREKKSSDAVAVYREALDAARDVDQIRRIAKELREKGQTEVDLPRHFGFLMDWRVIGPFDNTGRAGFETVYGPEKGIDLEATYPGKSGEVAWSPYSTTDEYGMVDFNDPFTPLKEVTGYAFTEFHAAEERDAEIRLGCKNAWKIWFNGNFVFGRDEYHRGMRIDQYRLPIRLEKGRNVILVKACQNEEDQTWTREWQFQLRICDSTGTAILSTDRDGPRDDQ